MTKAIRIHQTGGPEELSWDDVDVGSPGEGEVRLRHTAVGLNYIDVYHRTGLYPIPAMPSGIGLEACGVIEEVGPGVDHLSVGDRVAYAGGPLGAYCQERVMPVGPLVAVPDTIDDQTAAGMMLQGLTAQYLLRRTFRVEAGQTILFHAAAGGVGQIACQWAKHLGCTVIGTVGSDEKAAIAKANGCDHTINYNTEDFVERVKDITNGEGLPVVYDSVGKDSFDKSLDCLAPRGFMVWFGNASGPVPPFDLQQLQFKGSLYVTRPTILHYMAKPEELKASAADLMDVVGSGAVKISVNQTYPLENAAQAHIDLEARKTTGSTVLTA